MTAPSRQPPGWAPPSGLRPLPLRDPLGQEPLAYDLLHAGFPALTKDCSMDVLFLLRLLLGPRAAGPSTRAQKTPNREQSPKGVQLRLSIQS